MSFIMETPKNIEDLVKDANRKHSWKIRLSALNELKKYDCRQSRDVITRLALHDKVYKVKEEAFRAAQAFGITKNGKPIFLGKKILVIRHQISQSYFNVSSVKKDGRF